MKRPTEYKKNNLHSGWSEAENATLIRLWNENKSYNDIAAELNKTPDAIANYLKRNRHWLGLEKRPRHFRPTKTASSSVGALSKLDREWLGCVPLKHWTITKRWSNNSGSV